MARNTKVDADHNAPPVTCTLAKFVSTHPSRGWSDAEDVLALTAYRLRVGCGGGAERY